MVYKKVVRFADPRRFGKYGKGRTYNKGGYRRPYRKQVYKKRVYRRPQGKARVCNRRDGGCYRVTRKSTIMK